MKRAVAFAWAVCAVAVLAALPAHAQIATTRVPVAVQASSDTVPAIVPMGPPSAAPPETIPTPEPTAVPTIDPGTFKVPKSIFEPLLDGLLKSITSQITPFLNKVTQLGFWIYSVIAAISIALTVLQSFILGEYSFAAVARYLYWRIVEWGIWGLIIRYTWSGIGPDNVGWFSAIVSMFADVASKVAGIDASFSTSGGWNLDVLPGKIADLGVGLFSAIMAMVSIGKGGFWDVLGRTLDGTVLLSFALWLFGLISALYALFVCGSIAFKYLWTVVKVYVLGCLSFIQGFAGSRRLSGIAGSYQNAAIPMGAELAVTIILVGIMWHVIVGLTQALGFQSALDFIGNPPGPGGTLPGHLADVAYTAASLAVLDLALTLWAYAMWRVPKDVADLFAGRIQVSNGELSQAFQSSPFLAARAAGHGMNVMEQGATHGPVAAAGTLFSPVANALGRIGNLAAVGAVAGSGNGEGAGAIASGAVKGFLLGGPEGAAVGAIGAAVTSRMNNKETEGGSYSGEARGDGDETAQEREAASNVNVRNEQDGSGTSDVSSEPTVDVGTTQTAKRQTIIEDDISEAGGGAVPGDDGGDIPTRHRTRRTQVDEELVSAMRAMTAALNANTSANAQTMAAAAAGGSRSATRTSSGFDPLSEMDANISIGRMITQRALYQQMRQPRPQPPPREYESASMNIPVNLGK